MNEISREKALDEAVDYIKTTALESAHKLTLDEWEDQWTVKIGGPDGPMKRFHFSSGEVDNDD